MFCQNESRFLHVSVFGFEHFVKINLDCCMLVCLVLNLFVKINIDFCMLVLLVLNFFKTHLEFCILVLLVLNIVLPK